MKNQSKQEMVRAIEQLIEAVIGGEKLTMKRLFEIKRMVDAAKLNQGE